MARHAFADRHHAHQLLEIQDLLRAGHGAGGGHVGRGGQVHHLHLLVGGEVVQDNVEQEAVELGFGQRVGALQLDGVLGGQHEKRRIEFVPGAAHGAGQFLHGFEQRALGLRRRAVDFVGQQDVGENRPPDERPGAAAVGGIFLDDVGARDVAGHQVRRELDALVDQPQGLSHGAHQEGLGGAGEAGDQAVASHEQADHDLFQHLFLAYNDAAHLRHNLGLHLAEALDAGLQDFRF